MQADTCTEGQRGDWEEWKLLWWRERLIGTHSSLSISSNVGILIKPPLKKPQESFCNPENMAPSIVLTVLEPPAYPQVGLAGLSLFTPQMCACAAPTWVWRAASRGSLKSMTRWRSWASAQGARRKEKAK